MKDYFEHPHACRACGSIFIAYWVEIPSGECGDCDQFCSKCRAKIEAGKPAFTTGWSNENPPEAA